jgi:Flp pilus assembly protein TadB
MNSVISLLCLFILMLAAILVIGAFIILSQSMTSKGKNNTVPAAQAAQTKQPAVRRAAETEKKLEQVFNSMSLPEKQTAKEKALETFQSGILDEARKNAVNILSSLGEVEKF